MAEEQRVIAQELDPGLLFGVAGALRKHADPLTDLRRARMRDARDPESAPGRRKNRRENTDRSRLAGAVRPEQPYDLACTCGERQVLDRVHAAIGLREAMGLDRHSAVGAAFVRPGSWHAKPACGADPGPRRQRLDHTRDVRGP